MHHHEFKLILKGLTGTLGTISLLVNKGRGQFLRATYCWKKKEKKRFSKKHNVTLNAIIKAIFQTVDK